MKCEKCGKKVVLTTRYQSGRFCSSKCAKAREWSSEYKTALSHKMRGYQFGNAVPRGITYEVRICENPKCEKEFEVEPYKKTQYCSRKCAAWNHGGLRPNAGKHGSWHYCKELDEKVYLDSTWELELANWLDEHNMKWTRGTSFRWIDKNGKQRRYYPDFILENNRILDIKNRYLEVKDKEKIERVMKQNNIVVEIINRKKLDEILHQ